MVGTQTGEVDTHTTAPGHNLGHMGEGLHNAATAIFWGGNHIAVIVGKSLFGPCTGQDTSTRNKTPVLQKPFKALAPLLPNFLFFLFGDTPGYPGYHLGRIGFYRLIHMLQRGSKLSSILKLYVHLSIIDRSNAADLSLPCIGIGHYHNRITH